MHRYDGSHVCGAMMLPASATMSCKLVRRRQEIAVRCNCMYSMYPAFHRLVAVRRLRISTNQLVQMSADSRKTTHQQAIAGSRQGSGACAIGAVDIPFINQTLTLGADFPANLSAGTGVTSLTGTLGNPPSTGPSSLSVWAGYRQPS